MDDYIEREVRQHSWGGATNRLAEPEKLLDTRRVHFSNRSYRVFLGA